MTAHGSENPHRAKPFVWRPCMAAAVLLATSQAARAQVAADTPRPVEQGVGDVDPLRTSLLVPLDRDLRLPTGWESVYPVRYRDTSGQVREGFARASGGLVAVFPWSVYSGSGYIGVPPDTVFHLGPLPEVPPEAEPAPEHPVGSRPDSRPEAAAAAPAPPSGPSLDARAALNAPHRSPVPPAAAVPSVWTDDAYRRHRMAGLLTRAAETP